MDEGVKKEEGEGERQGDTRIDGRSTDDGPSILRDRKGIIKYGDVFIPFFASVCICIARTE